MVAHAAQGPVNALGVSCAIDATVAALVAGVSQFTVIVPALDAGVLVACAVCAGGYFNCSEHDVDSLVVSLFI